MVSARVLLTTQRRVTAPPEERLRNRRSKGRASLASKERAPIARKSDGALAPERVVRLHGQDLALSPTIRVDRHGAMHLKWCRPGCR